MKTNNTFLSFPSSVKLTAYACIFAALGLSGKCLAAGSATFCVYSGEDLGGSRLCITDEVGGDLKGKRVNFARTQSAAFDVFGPAKCVCTSWGWDEANNRKGSFISNRTISVGAFGNVKYEIGDFIESVEKDVGYITVKCSNP